MNKDLRDYLNQFEIVTYRLTDGSHIIANEEKYDRDTRTFHLTGVVEIQILGKNESFLNPWMLVKDVDVVQIKENQIIASSVPLESVQIQYHKYLIQCNLEGHLTKNEITTVLKQLFNDPVDNFMNIDIDGGIDDIKIDNCYNPQSSFEWRKKWDDPYGKN